MFYQNDLSTSLTELIVELRRLARLEKDELPKHVIKYETPVMRSSSRVSDIFVPLSTWQANLSKEGTTGPTHQSPCSNFDGKEVHPIPFVNEVHRELRIPVLFEHVALLHSVFQRNCQLCCDDGVCFLGCHYCVWPLSTLLNQLGIVPHPSDEKDELPKHVIITHCEDDTASNVLAILPVSTAVNEIS